MQVESDQMPTPPKLLHCNWPNRLHPPHLAKSWGQTPHCHHPEPRDGGLPPPGPVGRQRWRRRPAPRDSLYQQRRHQRRRRICGRAAVASSSSSNKRGHEDDDGADAGGATGRSNNTGKPPPSLRRAARRRGPLRPQPADASLPSRTSPPRPPPWPPSGRWLPRPTRRRRRPARTTGAELEEERRRRRRRAPWPVRVGRDHWIHRRQECCCRRRQQRQQQRQRYRQQGTDRHGAHGPSLLHGL